MALGDIEPVGHNLGGLIIGKTQAQDDGGLGVAAFQLGDGVQEELVGDTPGVGLWGLGRAIEQQIRKGSQRHCPDATGRGLRGPALLGCR